MMCVFSRYLFDKHAMLLGVAMVRGPVDHDTFGTHNRARLSPSAATGLIGMRENVFIEDFFRTMGFLPFTTER